VISEKEFQSMLEKADEHKESYYRIRDKALICLLKSWGKRRGEVGRLEADDLQIIGPELSITFTLEKKRKKSLMMTRREKRMPLTDPLAGPILEHWQWMKTHQPECKFLFPRTFYSGLTGILTFDVSRHLTGRQILRRVKALNPLSWCHLFRETVGAEIVREDNSIMAAFKVMLRLDLEDERTALRYVRRYAIDRIRGVSQSEIEAIRKVIDETPLTEKQRGILLKVLEGL